MQQSRSFAEEPISPGLLIIYAIITVSPDRKCRLAYLLSKDDVKKVNVDGIIAYFMYLWREYANSVEDFDNKTEYKLIDDSKIHQENLQAFQWVLKKSGEEPAIWAAWGTLVEKREYLKECLEDMVRQGDKYNAKWFKAGKLTKAGHPHHPLYLKKGILIEEFDVKKIFKNVESNWNM